MAEVKNNKKREANDKLGPISAVLSIVSDVIGIAMLPDNVIWLRYIILGLSIVLLLCLFRLLLGGHWRENMFETSLILVTLIFSLAVFFYLRTTPIASKDSSIDINNEVPTISLRYDRLSETAIQFRADVSGMDSTPTVVWKVSDAPGCSITDSGLLTTDGTPCSATVTGSFEYKGQLYSDTYLLSVESVESTSREEQKAIRYFAEIPKGMNTESAEFLRLKDAYGIYNSKEDAIADIEHNGGQAEYSDEQISGYVFFHWCRGESDAAYYTKEDAFTHNHPHNRRGAAERCADAYGVYGSFSCFYKKVQDISWPLCYAEDGSGCVWMPNYDICWDSYWYWMTEVRECTAVVHNYAVSISVQ